VAGWASVSEEARGAGGEPMWELMARHLKSQKRVGKLAVNTPKVQGAAGNPGMG